MRVKFRRWGPYVWWVCPSRKCNFENKTDLAFVQGTYETKCQYCNTPITIKLDGQQLSLESALEEEEAKPATPPAEPPKVPAPQPSQAPTAPAASPIVPLSSSPAQTGAPAAPPSESAAVEPESGEKAKDSERKKAAT